MKPHAHKSQIFLVCSLLVVVPVLLMWRTWRQVKLDQALMKAVNNNQAQKVRALLKAGADPNARVSMKEMPSLWRFLMRKFRRRYSGREELPEAPLFVVVQKEGGEYPVGEEPERDKPHYEPMKTDIVRIVMFGIKKVGRSYNWSNTCKRQNIIMAHQNCSLSFNKPDPKNNWINFHTPMLIIIIRT